MQVRKALVVSAVAATAASGLAMPGAATAAPTSKAAAAAPSGTKVVPNDVREVEPGKQYRLKGDLANRSSRSSLTTSAAAATPAVGTERQWLGLDDYNGSLYRKDYTLKAVGKNIEVWVASDADDTSTGTKFPAGDCRNATPNSTKVTTAQAQALADQFDNNILPKESSAFSVAPDRDGTGAVIPPDSDGNGGDYTGAGNRVVTLVDNVRDDNFYDFENARTYIAGFFSSQINELLDRNVMTIDAFDWLHRTGADPADEPTDDPCSSRPARARLYEGVFAHEYQHLLEYYKDPNEVNFINEGLSDFAISLTGYANTKATVAQKGTESHLACFNGFGTVETPYNSNPRDCGGPQNSLTLWGDEVSGDSILADYGNAWSFQLFLYDRYGLDFISALHRDGRDQGLDGVQKQLNVRADYAKVYDVLHDFQLMNLVDRYVGGAAGGTVTGRSRAAVTTKSLNATSNLLNPASYALPGAAPNGADYVGLRGTDATFLSGNQLNSVTFSGAKTLPPLPLKWQVTDKAPGREGHPTLWSGNESNLDAAAVTQVAVPTGSPKLTYTERHLAEEGYDYAYTMISTDGGRTYKALSNANTVDGPFGPALNGDAAGFVTQTFDLSAYAGETVLLAFRYVSDGGVNDGGWYVDNVKVGGKLISDGSSLAPFDSPTEVRATTVKNFHVQLVGLDRAGHRATVTSYDGHGFSLDKAALKRFAGYPLVAAIVAYDEPTEEVQQFASYTLKVNGVTQPGGH